MNRKVFFLAILTLSLSSCNDAFNQAVKGRQYNSTVWEENYYTVKEKSFEKATLRNEYNLTFEDKVFTNFESTNFKEIDPAGSEKNLYIESGEYSYSQYAKLSNTNEAVKEGVASKLFDGVMSCGGRYELARTQIKEEGFSYKFSTNLKNNTYFAMNFKSDNNFKVSEIPSHSTSFNLHVDLYFTNGNGYSYDRYSYPYINFKSNGNYYSFFGFPIKQYEGLIGFGISYSDLVDEYASQYAHALLIYEVLLPYSIW